MSKREGQLVNAFVRLADTLVADYDVVELAQQLVEDCVALLGASAAGLLLSDPTGGLTVLASTSEQARIVELFQLQSAAGPCLDCYQSGEQVHVSDLALDGHQWPAFSTQAQSEGFLAVSAIPLRLRDERIGALNLFRTYAGPLSAEDLALAQALADVATIGIVHQRLFVQSAEINVQLQTALTTRIVIEQAKGILAERSGLSMDDAFRQLRANARTTRRQLRDVAHAVVDGSELPGLGPVN
jgi:GAF domain-containing protein